MQSQLRDTSQSIFQTHLRPLADVLEDESTTEVMINTPRDVWVVKNGRHEKLDIALNDNQVSGAIRAAGRANGVDVKEECPDAIVNARVANYRIAGVLAPIAYDGHALCIRRHASRRFDLTTYRGLGFFDHPATKDEDLESANARLGPTDHESIEDFLARLMAERRNIILSGSTDAGKTSFFNALMDLASSEDRIVTAEDTIELQLGSPNLLRLLSNNKWGIPLRTLVALCLRLRPDRILVGEVRGAEAFDLLNAMNTGHEGTLATLHANSSFDALGRLEQLYMQGIPPGNNYPLQAIRQSIARSVDYVIHLGKPRGKRALREIIAVRGFSMESNEYVYDRVY